MEILGIDIGGSGIKGALVDTEKGELVSERIRKDTPQPATVEDVVQCIAAVVKEHNWTGPIGAGFPGVLKRGEVFTAANLDKGWIGQNIEQLISGATGCAEVAVINDADAAGLAEAKFGAGKGQTGLVMVITLGTGIGTALIVNGVLVPNCEMGHAYNRRGMIWEHYCAARIRKEENLEWPEWGERVNRYCEDMCRVLWPDMIIFGGGASKKYEKWQDAIKLDIPAVPAQMLNLAGIVGAALYCEQQSGHAAFT